MQRGASPRMRGPAIVVQPERPDRPAHPRACGDRRLVGPLALHVHRRIPARAGTGRPSRAGTPARAAHPRACGDRGAKTHWDRPAHGASPRVRGPARRRRRHFLEERRGQLHLPRRTRRRDALTSPAASRHLRQRFAHVSDRAASSAPSFGATSDPGDLRRLRTQPGRCRHGRHRLGRSRSPEPQVARHGRLPTGQPTMTARCKIIELTPRSVQSSASHVAGCPEPGRSYGTSRASSSCRSTGHSHSREPGLSLRKHSTAMLSRRPRVRTWRLMKVGVGSGAGGGRGHRGGRGAGDCTFRGRCRTRGARSWFRRAEARR